MSWTSPTLPKLADILTPDQASLIGSLYSFGAAFGPLTTAICLDSLGRKATLYILGACFLISWIVLATSMNIYVMYAARIIGGLGVGGTFSSGSVFVAEFAEVRDFYFTLST
ncbi:hypothetical protein O3M35_012283 [Rhynocoris fuscipes]|uniref:Major facilitator superfamily (MFS) profile domain-containing protein n=1 Tax=Rhynocoris fuscipes TaxID=488301 RepID=A0AAW1CVD6_9HEMI